MFFATIKTFTSQMYPTYRLHAFTTAEDRDAFVAADPYDADHAHRRALATTPKLESYVTSMTLLSEIEGNLPDDLKTSYGDGHRYGVWSA